MAGVKKLHYLLCSQKVATSMGGMGQLEVALFDVVHKKVATSMGYGAVQTQIIVQFFMLHKKTRISQKMRQIT